MNDIRHRTWNLLTRRTAAFPTLTVLLVVRYALAGLLFVAAALLGGVLLIPLVIGVADLFGIEFYAIWLTVIAAAVYLGVWLLPRRRGAHAASRLHRFRGRKHPAMPSPEAFERLMLPEIRECLNERLEAEFALPPRTPPHECRIRPSVPQPDRDLEWELDVDGGHV